MHNVLDGDVFLHILGKFSILLDLRSFEFARSGWLCAVGGCALLYLCACKEFLVIIVVIFLFQNKHSDTFYQL